MAFKWNNKYFIFFRKSLNQFEGYMINIIKKENLVEVVSLQPPSIRKSHKFSYSEFSVSLYRGNSNDVVDVSVCGKLEYRVKLQDITIQSGDSSPVQATVDNWDELTDDLIKSKGGVGGELISEMESRIKAIKEDLKGYVKEVPNPAVVKSEVVDTNVTSGTISFLGIASDGRTYFGGSSNNGIYVLDDATGNIVPTNVTSGNYSAIGIGSDGRTYFWGNSGNGIKTLEITCANEVYVRRYGEWDKG
jgi:hypothetical protein